MTPLAESLFDTEPLRLLGSRCPSCQAVAFPQQSACPSCSAEGMEPVRLSPRGTLWSWTSQNYLPKSPPYATGETRETFRPYAVGFVELPEQLRVETRLVGREPEAYEIGMEMELVLVPLNDDVATYAFQPVALP
jgi:uncharacterized protein